MAPPRDAPPAPSKGGVGIGIALAFGWGLLSLVLGNLAGPFRLGLSVTSPLLPLFDLVVGLGYVVGVHVYAIRANRPKVLAGFWGTVAVAVLAFFVTCFALVWGFTSG